MFRSGMAARVTLTLAILSIAWGSGCAPLRLPAIDPTGQRIFLPHPNATTLVGPPVDVTLPSPPQPAFTAPPVPPPCPFPEVAPPAITGPPPAAACAATACGPAHGHGGHGHGGHGHCGGKLHHLKNHLHPVRQSRIVLMPKKVVAPVGGEVVLVSGLFASNGKPVKREELRWVLSQGSVGHFIEAGGHGHNLLPGLRDKHAELLSPDMARSRTTAKPKLLTRGTQSAVDDVALLAGQGWITVTSPSEGVSHVTVLAPEGKVWDQRRETATIYWLDARWELPAPATVRAGQAHTLQTQVYRDSAGAPATGWIVRYEIAAGSSASFLPSGSQVAEVPVDAAGQAAVQIQSAAGGSETASIRVQIIRPVEIGGGLPTLTVGQGWTSVTWTAPGLVLRAAGPPTARPGETLTYQIQVSNPGNVVTRGVTVKDQPPAGLVVLGSNPPFEQFGQVHQWPLGDLAPGQTQQIIVQCRLELDRTVRYGFQAESVDGLSARDEVETAIQLPTLALEMSGPEQAMVGDKVTFEVHVRNTSGRDLADVIVTDTYDPGLEQSEGAPSPIRRRLGPLPADQVKSFAVSFFVRQPGRLCHTLTATAPDGFTASSRACLEAGSPPQPAGEPSIEVQLTGPAQQTVGQFALYEARVTNSGPVPLTRVRIAMSYDPALVPRQASGGYRIEQGDFVWGVELLAPGATEVRQLNCLCRAAADAAACRVQVTCVQGVSGEDLVRTRIVAPPAVSPIPDSEASPDGDVRPGMNPPRPYTPPAGPAQPGGTGDVEEPEAPQGRIGLNVIASRNSVPVGGQLTYQVVVTNETDQLDENVSVVVRLPQGMSLVRVQGPAGVRASGDQGRTIEMMPIASLRAGEKLPPFRVEVQADQAGQLTFAADVRSRFMPQPVQATATTAVVP